MTSVAWEGSSSSNVRLRRLRLSDRPRIRRWMSDPAVIRFTVLVPGPEYGPVEPYDDAAADRYLDLLVRDPDRRTFAIEVAGVHVGNIGLKNHDWENGAAECFVEIGELSVRRQGVGSAAMRALLEIAFQGLRLTRVRLGVFEFNVAAIQLYRKLGFVDDGVYGSHWADGRFWVVNAMAVEAAGWTTQT